MFSRIKAVGWSVTLILFIAAIGCNRDSNRVVLKLGHALDTEHPVHLAMERMAELVAEKSGGQMQIDIYPSGVLGSEKESIEQVQLGILAMTKTSSGPMESFVPAMKVFGLPYLFRDDAHMWKVFNGEIGRELLLAGESKGLRGLCYYDAGARSFYTTERQIKSPADLAGLKIRVQRSEMAVRMIKAMGGSPTPIPFGELYTSLQQGVVDGAENNPPSFYLTNHYQVCKFYTLDQHTRLPDMLIMSSAVWNDLTPEQQTILEEAAQASVVYQRELWNAKQRESLENAAEAGVEILEPDKAPFREAVKSIWDEFNGTIVGEYADRIQKVN